MGVAIISAVGVLVAALITVVVSLITTNEKSARLLREAETLSKLTPGTVAHRLMENRLETSIRRYGVDSDNRWNQGSRYWKAFGGFGSAFAIVVWIYVGQRFDVTSWSGIYYFVYGAIISAVLATIGSVVVEQVRDTRRPRKQEKLRDADGSADQRGDGEQTRSGDGE